MSLGLLAAAALATSLGCACLALSQDRHWKTVTAAPRRPALPLRLAGFALLGSSLAACIARDGGGFAALMWPLLFAAGALATAALLTWRPAALRPVARVFARPVA